jgi:ABC-type branched-subunit amino acid transport system ATPase component
MAAFPSLGGISLSVGQGEFVGVLGHNGMGKTRLLKALMGYLPATAGQVVLDDQDITRATPAMRAQRGLGYVPQGRDIFPTLSVHENLRMGCLLSKTDERGTIDRVLTIFPRLTRLLERPGGEQQLLALARCLCGAPRLVLLDEPTEGIQPSIVEEIVETLRSLRATHGLTMILVEQDLQFIAALADRVLIIQKGVITREMQPRDATDPSLVAEFVGMGN